MGHSLPQNVSKQLPTRLRNNSEELRHRLPGEGSTKHRRFLTHILQTRLVIGECSGAVFQKRPLPVCSFAEIASERGW
jgi:hypothetical protein